MALTRLLPHFISLLLQLTLVLSGAIACQRSDSASDNAKKAEAIEETYYRHYIRGEYEDYIQAIASADKKPQAYREQMLQLLKQRHRQQEEEHGGPTDCSLVRYAAETKTFREAHLELIFRDGTTERIILPMVCIDGEWRIR